MDIAVTYNYDPLWKLLIDRKMKKKDLQKITHLSSNVITKMGRGESVNLETIARICVALECELSSVVAICRKGEISHAELHP